MGADRGAESLALIGGDAERTEAVPVGAEDVGEDVGVPGVAAAGGSAIAGSRGFESIRVDADNREPGLDQRVDQQTGGALDAMGRSPRARKRLRRRISSARPSLVCGIEKARRI